MREWIADTLVPKVEEMEEEEEMGASQVPCELIPSNDGIGPEGWFAEFETFINPMLVGTPNSLKDTAAAAAATLKLERVKN